MTTVSPSSTASSVSSVTMRVGLVEMEVVGLLLAAPELGELLAIATVGALDGTGVPAATAPVGAGLCAPELFAWSRTANTVEKERNLMMLVKRRLFVCALQMDLLSLRPSLLPRRSAARWRDQKEHHLFASSNARPLQGNLHIYAIFSQVPQGAPVRGKS
jgi:hypothetical protein